MILPFKRFMRSSFLVFFLLHMHCAISLPSLVSSVISHHIITSKKCFLCLTTSTYFTVMHGNKHIMPTGSDRSTLLVERRGKKLFINNIPIPRKEVYIRSYNSYFYINGRLCHGVLHISLNKKGLNIKLMSLSNRYYQKYTMYYAYHTWVLPYALPLSGVIKNAAMAQLGKTIVQLKEELRLAVDTPYKVRVLLEEKQKKEDYTWLLTSQRGFIIIEKSGSRFKKYILSSSTLHIDIKKNKVLFNKKIIPACQTHIIPQNGVTSFNNKLYAGAFILDSTTQAVGLINEIDLEKYIYGVLHSESWPGWPLEVNKAFAIACRSYVLNMMMRAQKSKLYYHVKDTNQHQRYNLYGIQQVPILQQSVDQTRGIFLAFNNKPILAMFDSCCGGVIPAHIADFDFKKAPYLARPYACTFCKKSNLYSWQAVYTSQELDHLISSRNAGWERVLDIRVHKKDKAGLVQEVMVKGKKKSSTIPGKKLYSLSKQIKSFSFSIFKKGKNIIFKGFGFGHHLGLCQWGARQMIREGWDYRSILQFYYPGTLWMTLDY